MTQCCKHTGAAVFHCPLTNKGVAFTEKEREELGLSGLLPTAVSTNDQQVERMHEILDRFEKPIDKALVLDSLHATDEDLYFRLLTRYTAEYMPVVYTPTVGEYCQRFSHIFRYPRGLFISYQHAGHVRDVIERAPNKEVDVIVVTDGERILGIGDQGINGMGIPIGKLALYTACAGIDPAKTLPVVLDVGTNREEYLNDPLYLGLRKPRSRGPEYRALVDEFIAEARRRWPNVLIQFEDFGNQNAFKLLADYQEKILCFNDDIQGTASVVVSGLYSAMRIKKEKLTDQMFLFFGAGEAACGIANLIADALVSEGMTREEALKHCALFDSKGLVTKSRMDELAAHKKPFAHDYAKCTDFVEAIKMIKPTGIIGVAAQPRTFTTEVLEEMSKLNERPIIFALSNPTSRAECTAEEAYRVTKGKALYASGSPFAPVEYEGKTFVPRQGNNSYVFPALGLGAVFSRSKWMPDGMFLVAAKKLAELVTDADLEQGSLYPSLDDIRPVSVKIGAAVAAYAYDNGLAGNERPQDLEKAVEAFMYRP
ncbi:NAD-dependent malic enzyme [Sutterella faecalis]|uniref:NAD-dependent malic enzyme n=2 Tax=Sutterella TaxID=40544 RepID=A0AAI9WN63_9BURK|nr:MULTISPECIES: NAD-dependent malic enzyme [Sutterella]KAB7651552.1 NAD-dependent malic enzyme [Sutterella seckii]MBE5691837.1 NAD-dependent malic enzyme [Sutterella sp.]QDA54711.1 NAD-dependent malic enzyme [Sutterella faecalis]